MSIKMAVRLFLALTVGGVAAQDERMRSFGIASFVPPSGFTLDSKPTVQTYVRTENRDLCMIVVYADAPNAPTSEAAFQDAWTAVFRAERFRRFARPQMEERVSPGGYRHAFGEGDVEDQAGNVFVARMHVFPAGSRVQSIVWIGNSRTAMDRCRTEWEVFFASLSFAGATAERAPAQAGPGVVLPSVDRAPQPPSVGGGPAPTQVFDNISFSPPAGWSVERSSIGVTLSPTRVQPGEVLRVTLLPGRRFTGTLESQFAAAWNETMAVFGGTSMRTVKGGFYDLDEPGRSRRGWEYLRGAGGMITNGTGGRWSVDLCLIQAGNRLERVVVVSREFRVNLSTLNATMNPIHEQAIRRLIFTLDFASAPSTPVAPATISNETSGVWGGTSMSFGAYKATFAVLFDDGTAFFGPRFPVRGLDGIDPSIEQPRATRYWGTYTMNGERGELRMPQGVIPIRRIGEALEVTPAGTPHRFARLRMPAPSQLEGTWCLRDGKCLQLDPAGRFRDQGAARGLEHATYDYPESPGSGEGTYVARDHTLILQYDHGQEFRIALLGLVGGATASPVELWLSSNPDILTRR